MKSMLAPRYKYRGSLIIGGFCGMLGTLALSITGEVDGGDNLPEDPVPAPVHEQIDPLPLLSAHREVVQPSPPESMVPPKSEAAAAVVSDPIPEPEIAEPETNLAKGEELEGAEAIGMEVRGWSASAVRDLIDRGQLVYLADTDKGTYVLQPKNTGGFDVRPIQNVFGLSQIEVRKDALIAHGPAELETALRFGSPARAMTSTVLVFTTAALSGVVNWSGENQSKDTPVKVCIELVGMPVTLRDCATEAVSGG